MSALPRSVTTPALVALLGLLLLGPGLPTRDQARDQASGDHAAGAPDGAVAPVLAPVTAAAVPPVPAVPPAAAPAPAGALPSSGAPDVVLEGSGWGHGVGMSQYGARAQAMAGWNHRQIVSHYYPGVRIGRLRNAAPPLRVGLFTEREVDASVVRLHATTRDGRAPSQPASVDLGAGPVPIPHGQAWQLHADGAGLVLRDAAGAGRGQGPGPAIVRFSYPTGRSPLLHLPQVGQSYQWGALEVHRVGAALQPVLVVPLELYLRGIAEMPSDWHHEALRAQAVTARTYALRTLQRGVQPGCWCHLGTTPLHQAYAGWAKEAGAHGGRWVAAVNATAGQVVTYQGALAWTYFSSSHGGRTEHSEHSWAYPNAIPYLRSVDDAWSLRPEAANPKARWRVAIPNATFARALGLGLREVTHVRVLSRTPGGTPLELEVTGVDAGGATRVHRWRGGQRGIAGADLKLAFRAELPSQQIASIGVGPQGAS